MQLRKQIINDRDDTLRVIKQRRYTDINSEICTLKGDMFEKPFCQEKIHFVERLSLLGHWRTITKYNIDFHNAYLV